MITQLCCPNGHQWEPQAGQTTCPICGSQARADAATITIAAEAATLPPAAPASGADVAAEPPSYLAAHPRYRVLELIGRGGMGAVYKAQHLMMQRTVALKVISEDLTGNPDAVQRFHREVQAVARLNHRNIVTAYDAEQVGDAHFLVMEYVPGTSLAKVVSEKGRQPVAVVCEWICQTAEGLHHAFVHGHVHRDIKPQNLMVTPDGQVKILDFGLARLATESARAAPQGIAIPPQLHGEHSLAGALTRVGSVMGTPDYIAPEQVNDSRVADIRSDIYSLGCTAYYLLTGTAPFPGGSVIDKLIAHQETTPKPITTMRQDVPAAVVEVIERMMAKRPENRFATPSEVVHALEPWRIPTATAAAAPAALEVIAVDAPTTVVARKPALELPAAPPKRRWRLFLGCVGIVLVSLLGCAGVGTWLVHYTTNKVKEVGSFFQDRSSKDELWRVVEETWQAPEPSATADTLLPRNIGQFTRTQQDTQTRFEELQFEIDGFRAVYQQGGKRIDVVAGRMTEADRDRIFQEAKQVVDGKQQAVRMSQIMGSATAKRLIYLNGPWKGVLWWNAGWLFAAHSKDDDDAERLLINLLRLTDGRPATKGKLPGTSKKK